jgi:hypothetical protein
VDEGHLRVSSLRHGVVDEILEQENGWIEFPEVGWKRFQPSANFPEVGGAIKKILRVINF